MILCDRSLRKMLPQLMSVNNGPVSEALINPASIDIRVGRMVLIDTPVGFERCEIPREGFELGPGDFALIETLEWLQVPNGYAMEVRLKSTLARQGLDLALAIWFDPGWEGIATLEIKNNRRYETIRLTPEQRIAQIMVHRLDGVSERPYVGRYNHAYGVEEAKL